jgi:hypothetical protein
MITSADAGGAFRAPASASFREGDTRGVDMLEDFAGIADE